MSWNNVLPAWMFFEEYAKQDAMILGAMESEWNAGISQWIPEHLWRMHRACFETYNEGGWNDGN